jgi:hypothetical protein
VLNERKAGRAETVDIVSDAMYPTAADLRPQNRT